MKIRFHAYLRHSSPVGMMRERTTERGKIKEDREAIEVEWQEKEKEDSERRERE